MEIHFIDSGKQAIGSCPMTVELKTCAKCGQQKPLDRFSTFTSRRGETKPRGSCWECRGQYAQINFTARAAYRRDYNQRKRSIKRERDRQRRLTTKNAVDKLKEGPCADCGRRFPPVAMDFDHVGPKSKSVANMVAQAYKIDLILEEIKKCELVCACCHRVRTAARNDNLNNKQKLRSLPERRPYERVEVVA
jgi:hypothetical protein